MRANNMAAMILAGGRGSRLHELTKKVAKPAVHFGGKYRIIDFPLSNCANSGISTVGVLTQYQPLRLNTHIGIGIPWDLDRNIGGVTVLPPYEKSSNTEWYTGTANAIYQNIDYMDSFNPDYVLILSGDHIYKMDYEVMLDYHKSKGAEVTLAAMPVPYEEAKRFGILITDDDHKINDFEENISEQIDDFQQDNDDQIKELKEFTEQSVNEIQLSLDRIKCDLQDLQKMGDDSKQLLAEINLTLKDKADKKSISKLIHKNTMLTVLTGINTIGVIIILIVTLL